MNDFDLRPRTAGEVLEGAIRLYLGNARALIALVACVVVPLQIAWAIIILATVRHGGEVPGDLFSSLHLHTVHEANGTIRTTTSSRASAALTWGAVVLETLVNALATAACVRALADAVAGAPTSIATSLATAARRLPALIVLYVVRFVGTVLGVILFIVPGVWLAVSWSVSVPALVLEGAGPGLALQRSLGLVRHRWWPVLGVIIVADLVVGLAGSALSALFGVIDGFSSHPALLPAVIAVTLGAIVTTALLQPFNAAVRTILYLDLRIRRGGEDLAALADQLGVPAPGANPGGDPWISR